MNEMNTVVAIAAALFAIGLFVFIGAILVMGFKALRDKVVYFSGYKEERSELLRQVADLREKVKATSAIAKSTEANI